jgi:hypothetical protein
LQLCVRRQRPGAPTLSAFARELLFRRAATGGTGGGVSLLRSTERRGKWNLAYDALPFV